MTHKDFMKQSLCKFQFTPTREGSYAIDTNFNFYFIHIRGRDETSINKIGATLKAVANSIETSDSIISQNNKDVQYITDQFEVIKMQIVTHSRLIKEQYARKILCEITK